MIIRPLPLKNLPLKKGIQTFICLSKKIMRELQYGRYLERSAALTYTTLFAIVPLLTVTYSMLSAIPALHGIDKQIQDFIFSNFVPSAGKAISHYLTDFSRQARNLTGVGMLFLLVTALLMLRTIDHSLNAIFHTVSNRKGISCFLLYWAILTLGPLLLGLGFALTSYLATIKFMPDIFSLSGGKDTLTTIMLRMLSLLLSTSAFTFIYLAVPNCKVKLAHAITGALFVTCVSYIIRGAFGFFLQFSHSYELIYGAFAFVPIFLVWIYLNWLVILTGACIVNALRQNNYYSKTQPLPPLFTVFLILLKLDKAFEKGKTLTYKQISQSSLPVSMEQWGTIVQWLIKQKIIFAHTDNSFSLLRPLSSIHVSTFIKTCPWPIPGNAVLETLQYEQYDTWLRAVIDICKQINNFQNETLDTTMTSFLQTNR